MSVTSFQLGIHCRPSCKQLMVLDTAVQCLDCCEDFSIPNRFHFREHVFREQNFLLCHDHLVNAKTFVLPEDGRLTHVTKHNLCGLLQEFYAVIYAEAVFLSVSEISSRIIVDKQLTEPSYWTKSNEEGRPGFDLQTLILGPALWIMFVNATK